MGGFLRRWVSRRRRRGIEKAACSESGIAIGSEDIDARLPGEERHCPDETKDVTLSSEHKGNNGWANLVKEKTKQATIPF